MDRIKYYFVQTIDGEKSTIKICDSIHLEDIMVEFENFLRGSGFVFDGYLTIENDNEK